MFTGQAGCARALRQLQDTAFVHSRSGLSGVAALWRRVYEKQRFALLPAAP